jgi:mannose-6-phosphate isomerase-like protein (cupin superfamily)
MPELITNPQRVPVPGGKVIDEFVGRASTGTSALSVARMQAPPGWDEPAQTPEFDEVTLVLAGEGVVEHDGGRLPVAAGQAVLTRAGERVRYAVGPDGADYVAVCLPAFSPETVHRDEDPAEQPISEQEVAR